MIARITRSIVLLLFLASLSLLASCGTDRSPMSSEPSESEMVPAAKKAKTQKEETSSTKTAQMKKSPSRYSMNDYYGGGGSGGF